MESRKSRVAKRQYSRWETRCACVDSCWVRRASFSCGLAPVVDDDEHGKTTDLVIPPAEVDYVLLFFGVSKNSRHISNAFRI